MARYDAGWGRTPLRPQYDQGFRPGGMGPERNREFGWGGEPEPPQEQSRGSNHGIYGPGRYGLGPYHERLRQRRRADDEVREEVEEALFYDTWVDADAITVEVEEGVVTLRGELPDYEEIRYATDDAWDVDGVRGVRSDLTVRGG